MTRRTSLEVAQSKRQLLEERLRIQQLEQQLRLYDAASTADHRPRRGTGASGNAVMAHAGARLRDAARWLDENDGNAIAVLDDLLDNIVAAGVTHEPVARRTDGSLHDQQNEAIEALRAEWWERPEITGEIPGTEVERLMVRTWLRDGEVFSHDIDTPAAPHPGPIPYSLELLEPDFVPFDLTQTSTNNAVIHGVEKDAWGRPLAYHVYKTHPGDTGLGYSRMSHDTKRVTAASMIHVAFRRRLHQTRGASVLHGAITTLADIKEAWESERVAMRVAAAMTGYVRRGPDFEASGAAGERIAESAIGANTLEFAPGQIYDVMADEVGTLGHDRPNNQFDPFTQALQRQIAGATGTRFSSISHRYDGSYSAQRQELVEGVVSYRRLFAYLLGTFYRRVYRKFIDVSIMAGKLPLYPGLDRATLYAVDIRPPALPWIDPLKEIKAYREAIEAKLKARAQVIREMGGDPRQVDRLNAMDPEAQEPEPAEVEPQPEPTQDDEERVIVSIAERVADRLPAPKIDVRPTMAAVPDAALTARLQSIEDTTARARRKVLSHLKAHGTAQTRALIESLEQEHG